MTRWLVGPGEIAQMFGVAAETVSRWQREGRLPEPDVRLLQGPVWYRTTIQRWADESGRAYVD